MRKLFEQAAKDAPSISENFFPVLYVQNQTPLINTTVFIDELDSIGRSRKVGFGNPEQEVYTSIAQFIRCRHRHFAMYVVVTHRFTTRAR